MKYDKERLTAEIARRQQSISEFARDVGVSRFALYRALTGSRANTRTLGKIAATLGIDNPTELLKPAAQM